MHTLRKLTRRQFYAQTGTLLGGGALIVPLATSRAGARGRKSDPDAERFDPACDFQRSFMTWDVPFRRDPRPHARHNIPHGNMARIQLDALIDVVDKETGKSEQFVLIAPCRTEWVYAEDRLFQIPSREYRNIYSLTEERDMGRGITHDGGSSQSQPVSDTFRSLTIDLQSFRRSRRLTTPEAVVEATAANGPLVGRTELDDPTSAIAYRIEYPIKTMNFQPKTNSFQVDTGPLLVPDFDSTAKRTIDRLELAHIAYNRLDRGEFILRRPTAVRDVDGRELCRVLHYSKVRAYAAANVILTEKSDG